MKNYIKILKGKYNDSVRAKSEKAQKERIILAIQKRHEELTAVISEMVTVEMGENNRSRSAVAVSRQEALFKHIVKTGYIAMEVKLSFRGIKIGTSIPLEKVTLVGADSFDDITRETATNTIFDNNNETSESVPNASPGHITLQESETSSTDKAEREAFEWFKEYIDTPSSYNVYSHQEYFHAKELVLMFEFLQYRSTGIASFLRDRPFEDIEKIDRVVEIAYAMVQEFKKNHYVPEGINELATLKE